MDFLVEVRLGALILYTSGLVSFNGGFRWERGNLCASDYTYMDVSSEDSLSDSDSGAEFECACWVWASSAARSSSAGWMVVSSMT